MAITNSFKRAVEEGDVKDIRIMLKECLLVDPSFADFNEKSNYAKDISGIYIPHDGRELNTDESTWDDNYMNKLMAQLSTNFSHERVAHLKKVIRKLRPVSTRPQSQASTSYSSSSAQKHSTRQYRGYEKQKNYDQHNGSYRGAKIVAGAVAGAAVGGAIVASVGATVITGVAIGAVVGGVAVMIVTNGEN